MTVIILTSIKTFIAILWLAILMVIMPAASHATEVTWSENGDKLYIFDIEYTPNDLKEIKIQFQAARVELFELFKQSNAQLSNSDATKHFNNIFNPLSKQFDKFLNKFNLPENPTQRDILKWMSASKQENEELYSNDYKKFNTKGIDTIIELYDIRISKKMVELEKLRESFIASPDNFSRLQNNKKAVLISKVSDDVGVVAFLETCKARSGNQYARNINDKFYLESLFYTEKEKYARYVKYKLTEAANDGSPYAAALLALIYINSIDSYFDFLYTSQESSGTYYNIKELEQLSLKYINQAMVKATKDPKLALLIGDFYKSENQDKLAKTWYKLANKEIAVKESITDNDIKQPTNQINSSIVSDSVLKFLYKEGWDIAKGSNKSSTQNKTTQLDHDSNKGP